MTRNRYTEDRESRDLIKHLSFIYTQDIFHLFLSQIILAGEKKEGGDYYMKIY